MCDMQDGGSFRSVGFSHEPFRTYGQWLRGELGFRVQKLSIDGGFSCPNRDGSVGWGGCRFCSPSSYSPLGVSRGLSIPQQLEEGKRFFSRKYPDMKYLAYFQSFSSTYAPLDVIQSRFQQALEVKDVVGLVVSTRPDLLGDDVLDYLQSLSERCFLILEIGVESFSDDVLRSVNRGHRVADSISAIRRASEHELNVGVHLIAGLPGENMENFVNGARFLSSLPVRIVKLHQLQVLRGTALEADYISKRFHVLSEEEYLRCVCGFLCRLRGDVVVERFLSQSPRNMVIAPDWGTKNHVFTERVIRYMNTNGLRQGMMADKVGII